MKNLNSISIKKLNNLNVRMKIKNKWIIKYRVVFSRIYPIMFNKFKMISLGYFGKSSSSAIFILKMFGMMILVVKINNLDIALNKIKNI